MTRARRAITVTAASSLVVLGGIALAAPAQADVVSGSVSVSDRSAVLKNFVNDLEFGILADGKVIYFKDLKQEEQIPPASN
ncbi:hypothetical protein [Streptomyces syringium]|uniref:hypothetical protein n=1 Tax=Streptomyces syringium TaxID=76729 RepID=UPI0033EF7524